jgi:hypothetical protein
VALVYCTLYTVHYTLQYGGGEIVNLDNYASFTNITLVDVHTSVCRWLPCKAKGTQQGGLVLTHHNTHTECTLQNIMST